MTSISSKWRARLRHHTAGALIRGGLSQAWAKWTPFFRGKGNYFCDEPWIGILSVETNLDVKFCPCYLNMKIGRLDESSIEELWNARPLVDMRRAFARGELPRPCRGQLCPVATGARLQDSASLQDPDAHVSAS